MLDVMLPQLDGISLCRRRRSQGYQMPILLLTGRDSGHEKAKSAGRVRMSPAGELQPELSVTQH